MDAVAISFDAVDGAQNVLNRLKIATFNLTTLTLAALRHIECWSQRFNLGPSLSQRSCTSATKLRLCHQVTIVPRVTKVPGYQSANKIPKCQKRNKSATFRLQECRYIWLSLSLSLSLNCVGKLMLCQFAPYLSIYSLYGNRRQAFPFEDDI